MLTSQADVHQRARLYQHRGNVLSPLSELQAAVLLPQLDKLDARITTLETATKSLADRAAALGAADKSADRNLRAAVLAGPAPVSIRVSAASGSLRPSAASSVSSPAAMFDSRSPSRHSASDARVTRSTSAGWRKNGRRNGQSSRPPAGQASPNAAGTPSFLFDPPTVQAVKGGTFMVNLLISGAQNVSSVPVQLNHRHRGRCHPQFLSGRSSRKGK